MSGLRFASPLWFLAALAVLVALWIHHRRSRRREVVVFGDTSVLAELPRTLAERLAPIVPALRVLGLVLIVIVLARPQFGRSEEHRRTDGIAIEVALDTSESMLAMDFQIDDERVDRMEVVKRTFAEFVRGDGERLPGRPNDLIGLIAFGGYADSRVPLTLDHDALVNVSETLRVPERIMGPRGVINQEELLTAIGDALALAVERIKDAPTKSKVVILLTDGENTAGVIEPMDAARVAAELGIRVYTIGVGSKGRAPYPVTDAFGRTALQWRPARLDERLLAEIASLTGGVYQNANDLEALKEVYAEIDDLERTKLEGLVEIRFEERYRGVLYGALTLLLAFELLVSTRFRGIPS